MYFVWVYMQLFDPLPFVECHQSSEYRSELFSVKGDEVVLFPLEGDRIRKVLDVYILLQE
jgi:hypothetical protein